jgi:hypothetical protein
MDAGQMVRIIDAEGCLGRALVGGEPVKPTDSATIARERKAAFGNFALNRF